MKFNIRALGLCLLAGLWAAAVAQAAEAPWVIRSNDSAKVLLQVLAKYSPESASQIGAA